jgi:hypothetical protein
MRCPEAAHSERKVVVLECCTMRNGLCGDNTNNSSEEKSTNEVAIGTQLLFLLHGSGPFHLPRAAIAKKL